MAAAMAAATRENILASPVGEVTACPLHPDRRENSHNAEMKRQYFVAGVSERLGTMMEHIVNTRITVNTIYEYMTP